jgi:uncharacterized membrane protein YsdA (DUF1294 family)
MRSPGRRFAVAGLLVAAGGAAAARAALRAHPIVAALCGINAATFLLYGIDKRRSRTGAPRVPEFILHVFALLGGSPAALVGQAAFRHKTRKASFLLTFWLIVVLQVALAAYLVSRWR